MVNLKGAKNLNQEHLICSTSKWSDVGFQRPYSTKNLSKNDLINANFKTHDVLNNQYLGKKYETITKVTGVEKKNNLEETKLQKVDPQINQQKVASKIGTDNLSGKEQVLPFAQPSNSHQESNLGYMSKIKKKVTEIKQEGSENEFLNYSKYHRFKPQKANFSENVQEFKVDNQTKNIDKIDFRRKLIDLKIPFSFAGSQNEVSEPNERNFTILLKGNQNQIAEWKNKINQQGLQISEAKAKFNLSSRFTDKLIEGENCASKFLPERKDVGKISKSLTEKKREILNTENN